MENEIVYLYLDDIIPNRFQPREVFDEKALKELALSIREHGVIQPIIVRKIGTKYEIIAGERRYKASTMAGLTKIPAIIKNLDDKESSKVALIENLQRKDLTPIEEARTYQKILDIDSMTQEELAKTMGKSQSAVSNKLRLLTLSNKIQDALLNEKISERHARSLLNIEDEDERDKLADIIMEKRLSVKEFEELIKDRNNVDSILEEESKKEIPSMPFETLNQDNKLNEVDDKLNDIDFSASDFESIVKNMIKEDEAKKEKKESSKADIKNEKTDVELLDLTEDEKYYSFEGLKKINQSDFNDCLDMVRNVLKQIEEKGYKVKNDELDLESKHRFIIEIEKN